MLFYFSSNTYANTWASVFYVELLLWCCLFLPSCYFSQKFFCERKFFRAWILKFYVLRPYAGHINNISTAIPLELIRETDYLFATQWGSFTWLPAFGSSNLFTRGGFWKETHSSEIISPYCAQHHQKRVEILFRGKLQFVRSYSIWHIELFHVIPYPVKLCNYSLKCLDLKWRI